MTTLNVYNPTSHTRIQPIIFGTRDQTSFTYRALPKSFLNVGTVIVPAGTDGLVDILPDDGHTAFQFHPAIGEDLGKGWQIWIKMNGEKVVFQPIEQIDAHKNIATFKFMARCQAGVAYLWAYVFHNYPVVKYELGVYCESLTTNQLQWQVDFGTDGTGLILNKMWFANPGSLINQSVDDCQGRVFSGNLTFLSQEILSDPTLIQTLIAEQEYPLFAVAQWPTWGPWDKPVPTVTPNMVNQEFQSRIGLPYAQPFGHFGQIGQPAAGSTGDQGGWGTWQQFLQVGGQAAKLSLLDYLAAMQDNCRPVHYFEPDGTRFQAHNHWSSRPCVFWSQQVHWHTGVSPDRLRRTHDSSFQGPWSGYDEQHAGAIVISNQAILHGSLAAMDYCKSFIQATIAQETLPSQFPGYSTNGCQVGRASRLYMAHIMCYFATGNREGIDHEAQRMTQCLFQQWEGRNTSPMKITAWGSASTASGALPLYDSWTPWQDAIFVMCADALRITLQNLGHQVEADQLHEIIWQVGKTVVNYGFDTSRPINAPQIGTALAWFHTGAPYQATDPNQTRWADGTDYAGWSTACLQITIREAIARNDTATQTLAQQYLSAITNNHLSNYTYWLQFAGAL